MKPRPSTLLPRLAALGAALAGAIPAGAEEYSFRIPVSVTGYAGESAFTDFPALVRLAEGSPAGFSYADCAADGSDIRFADAGGAALAFDIDTWNTNGESCIWVKLPSMRRGTAFEMRYGGAPTSSNDPAATWSAYGAVWHLGEASGTCANSTAAGAKYAAAPQGDTASSVRYAGDDAPVGHARRTATEAARGWLRVPDVSDLGYGSSFTISGWVRLDSLSGWPRLFSGKDAHTANDGWEIEMASSMSGFTARGSGNSALVSGSFSPSLDKRWSYVALRFDGTALTVFQDGRAVKSGTVAAPAPNAHGIGFGCNATGSNSSWARGAFDECRLMGGAAPDDWIAADYAAQTGTLLSLGPAESLSLPFVSSVSARPVCTNAVLFARLASVGAGATSATLSLSVGTDASNLPPPAVVRAGVPPGETVALNVPGLAPGTTYHYALAAENDASPSRSRTVAGSFATDAFGAPEIEVRATPGLASSAIAVRVRTPGLGSAGCGVFLARGAGPDALGAEETLATAAGIGEVCTKAVASPTAPLLTHWRVRAVNDSGLSAEATGTLDTGIRWWFDEKNKRLTNAVGWKVKASKGVFQGAEGYRIDGADSVASAPKDETGAYLTELDLTGLKDTGLDIVCIGAHSFYDSGTGHGGLTALILPDTIRQIDGQAFTHLANAEVFEPHVFPDLVAQQEPNGLPPSPFADPVVHFPNPAYATYPQQTWCMKGDKAIHFGPGLVAIGSYAFDASGATDLYLTGDTVPTTGSFWHRNAPHVRVNVPVYSEDWAAYAAASAADPTAAQTAAYEAAFPDGRPLWKVGRTGQTPDYGGIYLCRWRPDDFCRNSVHVRGNVEAGDVFPAYGKNACVPQRIVCTAPPEATFEGVDYACEGYVLETLGEDGWGAPATNAATSFALDRIGEATYRVTWLWRPTGYRLEIVHPPSGVVDGVSLAPGPRAVGSYAPGTVVTLAPTIGGGFRGPFSHWEGDVPEECRTDSPLVVTMDRARTLVPVFASAWKAVPGYETSRVTDGYWVLKIGGAAGRIHPLIDAMNGVEQPCAIGMLDLRKPVEDGRIFDSIDGYAFRRSYNQALSDLRLPDTLEKISTHAFEGQTLRSIEPCFPDSVTNIGNQCFGPVLFTNAVRLLNRSFTVYPGQLFGSPWHFRELHLGPGVTEVGSYAFDAYFGAPNDLDVYLNGDVPSFGTEILRGKAAFTVRFFFPKTRGKMHLDWRDFCAENVTPLTEAETAAYYAKYGDDAPAPAGWWKPPSANKYYVVRHQSPFDPPVATVMVIK